MGIKEKLIQALSLNVVLWLIMLLGFSGLLLCAGGIYLWLAEQYSQPVALLITGGGLIASVILPLLLGLLVSKARRGKPSKAQQLRQNPDNLLEQQVRPVLGDQATDWAKRNTGLAVVGALSAGVILASSSRLRSTIFGAVSPVLTRKVIQAVQQFSDD